MIVNIDKLSLNYVVILFYVVPLIMLCTQPVLTELLLLPCSLSCLIYTLSSRFTLCPALPPRFIKTLSGSLALMVGSEKLRAQVQDWREKERKESIFILPPLPSHSLAVALEESFSSLASTLPGFRYLLFVPSSVRVISAPLCCSP